MVQLQLRAEPPAPPLLRAASESALAHLIRAQPLEKAPLVRLPPRSPHLASWCSAAEHALVEEELCSLLKESNVVERRKRIERNAAAVRDYEAGRSPPASTKIARARAEMLRASHFTDKSVDDVRERASVLVPRTPKQTFLEKVSLRSSATAPQLQEQTPMKKAGASLAVPATSFASAPTLHHPQSRAATPAAAATVAGKSHRPSRERGGGGYAPIGAAPAGGSGRSGGGWGGAPAGDEGGSSPGGEYDEVFHEGLTLELALIAAPDLRSIRSVAAKDVQRTRQGVGRKRDGAPPEGSGVAGVGGEAGGGSIGRLEVMPRLHDPSIIRAKARASLLMSDTLLTKGSLQRRDLLPAGRQAEDSRHALLSPRNEKGGAANGRRRRGGGKHGGGGGGVGGEVNGEAGGVGGGGGGGGKHGGGGGSTMAAHHNATLEGLHSATLLGLPFERPPEPQKLRGAGGGERRGAGGPLGAPSSPSPKGGRSATPGGGAPAAAAAAASPPRRVNFASAAGGGAGGAAAGSGGAPASSARRSSRESRELMGASADAEPLWRVARLDNAAGGEPPTGPNEEVEGRGLRRLPRDSLIWTEGLQDWLPLGPVPPLGVLPPPPMPARAHDERR